MELFAKDEEEDEAFLKTTLLKEKGAVKIAERLSLRYGAKYSHEFRGLLKIQTDPVGKWWTLICGDKKVTLDDIEIKEIPERIRFFRELNRRT